MEEVVQPATRSLVIPETGAISGAQCWSLLLAGLALSSSCSQVNLGEWKSMLSSPCITPISITMATLFMGPLGNDWNGWGKRVTVHSMVILST